MHREKISAGEAGTSEIPFPCEASFPLCEQEEMCCGQAATGMEHSSSLQKTFPSGASWKTWKKHPNKCLNLLPSLHSQLRQGKHVKQC